MPAVAPMIGQASRGTDRSPQPLDRTPDARARHAAHTRRRRTCAAATEGCADEGSIGAWRQPAARYRPPSAASRQVRHGLQPIAGGCRDGTALLSSRAWVDDIRPVRRVFDDWAARKPPAEMLHPATDECACRCRVRPQQDMTTIAPVGWHLNHRPPGYAQTAHDPSSKRDIVICAHQENRAVLPRPTAPRPP